MALTARFFDETEEALTGAFKKLTWAQTGVEAMDLINTEASGGKVLEWTLNGTNLQGRVDPGAVKTFQPVNGRYYKFLSVRSVAAGATYRLEQA